MAQKEFQGGRLFDLYTRYVGEPQSKKDVYGYWTFIVGYLVGFVGVIVFLASPAGSFQVREVAITMAAIGLPVGLLGIVLTLPVRRRGIQSSLLGSAIALFAVIWFVTAYPENWGGGPPDYRSSIIAVYSVGVALVGATAALVPILTGEKSLFFEADASRERDHPAVMLGEASKGALFSVYDDGVQWSWRLIEQGALAGGADSYLSRLETEEVVDRVKEKVREASLLEIKNAAFRLYESEGGGFRWMLMRENGSVVAESDDEFESRDEAEEAVNLVKERGSKADLVDIRGAAFDVVRDGTRWRWRLLDEDHNELARSTEAFELEADADDSLEHIRDVVGDAEALAIDTFGIELYDMDGEWRWRLLNEDDEHIASSTNTWESRRSAEDSVYDVLDRVGSAATLEEGAPGYEVYASGDAYRWRFVDDEGETNAVSHAEATSVDAAEHAAQRVAANFADADIAMIDEAGFEVYPDGDQWHWRLVTDDRKLVADASEAYGSEEDAVEAVDRLRNMAAVADLIEFENAAFQLYEHSGEWRWRLIDEDGNVMADSSENYASRDAASSAMTTLKKNAPDADLIEIETAAFELYEEGGDWNWRLVDETGREVAEGGNTHPSRNAAHAAMERLTDLVMAEGRVMDRPTLQIYPDDDTWRWRFVDTDGAIMADGPSAFATRDEAGTALDNLREEAANAPVHVVDRLAIQVSVDDDGDYRWRLIDAQREPVAESDATYETSEAVFTAVESVQQHLSDATVFDIEGAAFRLSEIDGGWSWQLIDEDRSPLATAPGPYQDRDVAERSMRRVRTVAPSAERIDFDDAAFELVEEADGWYWRLIDDDYAVIATGAESVVSREAAESELETVKEVVGDASLLEIDSPAFELHEENGAWRWRLIDEDGNELGNSAVSYQTREEARDALGTVKEFAPEAMKSVAE